MKGSICHIEIPADNLGALQGFYGDLFEWDFERIPGDMEYYNVKHGEEKPMGGMMARVSPDQRRRRKECGGTRFLQKAGFPRNPLRQKLLDGWR